ncbi:unnamed protein product [Lepeophtheirus salmonis]|uniref:(salmon louse) hypothetical protein n=1 Tax=Lepeophtheirus salmonis TaxID=72036 RepID=A0A7R8D299_LEPSM|nr:unnamed protein product [Lepeophtheirus salmonis]CAF3003530.1 unnamed protein product [Lepeophtheirus salmonis]
MPCCMCDPDCPEEMKGVAFCAENIPNHDEKIHSLADMYIHTRDLTSDSEINFNEQMRSSGSPIRTVMGDYVTFPQNTFRGECVKDVPIRYLRETRSACTTVFYPYHCLEGSKSLYDTLSYINPSNLLRLQLGPEFDSEVPISIEYYLSKDPSPYLSESKFPDDTTTIFLTSNHTPLNSKKHIMKAEFGFCSKVVLEVIYHFLWRGSNITSIKAQILLGNIPLSDYQIIHQFFQVNFDQKVQKVLSKTQYIRFGHTIPIRTHGGDDYLSTYSNGASCQKGGMENVLFGDNTFTSCRIVLSKNDFNNCSLLRENIESMIVDHLLFTSILKANDKNEVLTQLIDLDESFLNVTFGARNLAFQDGNSTIMPFCEVPNHFYVDILYLKGPYPYIIGVKLSVTNDILEWSEIQKNIMEYEFFHSINFHETSYHFKEENYSRFWRQQSVGYCSGDSCWNDLFFLFTEVDDIKYRTQWILVLTPVIIFYLWATKRTIHW